jgi:hypothetical protein
MKRTHFVNPHVYVGVFRCEACNGPMVSRLISEGTYTEQELADHPFPVVCAICSNEGKRFGSKAAQIIPLEWPHEIRFIPPR